MPFPEVWINILDRTDRSRERASVVVAVEGVQQRTILTDQSNFRCGGTCIDTEVAVSFVSSQIAFFTSCPSWRVGKHRILPDLEKADPVRCNFEFHMDIGLKFVM